MKPRILLSANIRKQYYIDAVNLCGGVADARYCPAVDTDYDGLILCGGNDIDPRHYGEENRGSFDLDTARDEAELALLRAFVEAKKPILGICRGLQLMNVFFGGSLCQDLPNAELHKRKNDVDAAHSIDAGGWLGGIYGEQFFVNSAHHQGIRELGAGLTACATAGQVIEAIEHKSLPIIAVQFHPERMCFSGAREDTVDGAAIFEYFVKLCQNQESRFVVI